eukprot:1800374-Pyramimonas_sp.AAC.1
MKRWTPFSCVLAEILKDKCAHRGHRCGEGRAWREEQKTWQVSFSSGGHLEGAGGRQGERC